MRLIALAMLALLATGCAAPSMRHADGLVDAFPVGVHEVDAIEIHVHESPAAVHEVMRDAHPDNPAIVVNEALGIRAHAWTSIEGDELHLPAPTAPVDPVWLCTLGHELSHAATGRWHPPGLDIAESCGALAEEAR
jgi:hypothetical protein